MNVGGPPRGPRRPRGAPNDRPFERRGPGARRPGPPRSGPPRGGPPRSGPPRGGPRPEGRPNHADIEKVFADDDIVVVSKPAGLPLTGGRARNAKAGVAEIVARLLGTRERPARVWPVHDMDREASGLAVFARSRGAADELREAFKRGRCTRVYAALVALADEEAPDPTATSMNTLLRPNRRGVSEVVPLGSELEAGLDVESDFSVRAVTHTQPRDRNGRLAIVRFRAETDYPFQVRAHAAFLKMPIVGDRAYDAPEGGPDRLCMHADELAFEHPRTRKTVRYRLTTPPLFREILQHGLREPSPAEINDRGWDHVADWYAEHLASSESDHQTEVVRPGVRDLLNELAGTANNDLAGVRVLDLACGEGSLSRELAGAGASVHGVDIAERLIDTARERAGTGAVAERLTYDVGDARAIEAPADRFDAAACVLALMNIDDHDAVFHGVSGALKTGGVFVAVVLHPAFRSPKNTAWGFANAPLDADPASGPGHRTVQFRRVDGYLTPAADEIVMNPGAVASGAEPVVTTTHTRPIGAYVRSLAAAGLLVERLDEWPSHRRSQPGPRADAENHARAEIPLFLAIAARKVADPIENTGEVPAEAMIAEPEPVTPESVTEEPATPEPVTPEPEVPQPAKLEPGSADSAATEPTEPEPTPTEPDADEPDATDSSSISDTDAGVPDAGVPDPDTPRDPT